MYIGKIAGVITGGDYSSQPFELLVHSDGSILKIGEIEIPFTAALAVIHYYRTPKLTIYDAIGNIIDTWVISVEIDAFGIELKANIKDGDELIGRRLRYKGDDILSVEQVELSIDNYNKSYMNIKFLITGGSDEGIEDAKEN